MQKLGFSLFISIAIGLFSCAKTPSRPEFPKDAKVYTPVYSKLFKIAHQKNHTFIKLIDPADSTLEIGNFSLGESDPQVKGFEYIANPSRLVALSAVFVGMVEALHAENNIVAVDNLEFISSPRTLKRIKGGFINAVAPNSINPEKLLASKPGLVLGYYIDIKGKEAFAAISSKGIPVMFLQNFLESHPLGRAEWLLLIGAISGKFKEAESLFAEIEEHYLSTMARVTENMARPKVLINAPFSGTWDVPAGDSYMANLVKDAGGSYSFSQTKGTGRIPMGIEQVFTTASDAEFWINPGACRTSGCLLMMDKRMKLFKAYQQKQVYNCTKLLKENGANAWWDYGVMRPDLVLLDLFTVLHPQVYSEHTPVFFEKVQFP